MNNYIARCKDGSFTTGKLLTYHAPDGKCILLFPTKKDWRDPSRMEYIESALDKFEANLHRFPRDEKGNLTIAFPPVGCGLGGLKWSDVRKSFEKRFSDRKDVHVSIYSPQRTRDRVIERDPIGR